MVRFARASGSKGANEKRPEDPTPWSIMKSGMNRAKKQKPDDLAGTEDWDPDESATSERAGRKPDNNPEENIPTTQEIQTVWAELVSESKVKTKKKKKLEKDDEPVKSKKRKSELLDYSEKPSKKKKRDPGGDKPVKRSINLTDEDETKLKKNKFINLAGYGSPDQKEGSLEEQIPKKKRTEKKKIASDRLHGEKSRQNTFQSENKKIRDVKSSSETWVENSKNWKQSDSSQLVKKVPKVQTPREKGRRKEALQKTRIIINGKEVEIAPFDSFPILADDAERLTQLRKDMTAKGIPKAEREGAIKLERRRCEKALARLKKSVCFQCRGSGHNLSECPEVSEGRHSTGMCYKCGSAQHTHFECKVNRRNDYPFAECFICKEQGHISKQCPQNPRGLYPRGGGCALCMDVTHLRKDCPQQLAAKASAEITADLATDAVEGLEEDRIGKNTLSVNTGKKPNKHIKF